MRKMLEMQDSQVRRDRLRLCHQPFRLLDNPFGKRHIDKLLAPAVASDRRVRCCTMRSEALLYSEPGYEGTRKARIVNYAGPKAMVVN